jgi:hypothetical protein
VYAWADGLYVKAAHEDTKGALMVIVGALRDGAKWCWRLKGYSGNRRSRGLGCCAIFSLAG